MYGMKVKRCHFSSVSIPLIVNSVGVILAYMEKPLNIEMVDLPKHLEQENVTLSTVGIEGKIVECLSVKCVGVRKYQIWRNKPVLTMATPRIWRIKT